MALASFNSGIYGGGNYEFESTRGGGAPRGTEHMMFDDREFDEQPVRKSVPLRRIGEGRDESEVRGGPARAPQYLDEPEPYDDYRPGTILSSPRGIPDAEPHFDDDFDDQLGNFDDDFDDPRGYAPRGAYGAPPPRRGYDDRRPQRPPQPRPGSRLGYSRYDDDYTDSDFEAEYSGLKGIQSRKRPQGDPEPNGRLRGISPGRGRHDQYEQYEEEPDYDDYYGNATIRDKGFQGDGVPRVFAQFFDRQDEYDEMQRRRSEQSGRRSSGSGTRGRNRAGSVKAYRRRKNLIAAAIVCGVLALVAAPILYFSLGRMRAPLNVATSLTSMNGTVSGNLLKASIDNTLGQKSVAVECAGRQGTLRLADCDFQYSTEEDGTEEVVVIGQDVSGSDITEKYVTKGTVKFNETKVREFLYDLVGTDGVRMVEPYYNVSIVQDMDTKIYTGTLKVKAGTDGVGIDYDTFIGKLIGEIAADRYDTITGDITQTVAPKVDMDKIYAQVHRQAADAYSVTDGTGNVTYVADVIGVDFDKSAAAAKVAAGGTEWTFNLSLTLPNLTLKALKADTFPDLLATYFSEFNAGNKARASNVALAGDYINGTILQPGETFSFNDTVGQRTPERGFSKATVYSSEGTDEDYGGGICQTSSTLFYAAMKANLELVDRTNHMYTVSYLFENGRQVFGNDATVNWGYTDMKFKNNKEYPIKLEVITKSGNITVNIWGTWDGYTAEYRYVEKATESYQTIYRKYQAGKKNQAGQLGRTIWTYRVVFYEGKEVKRYREFESVYRPLSNIKYVTPAQLPAGKQFD